jgi:hypothetical protein
MIYEGEERTQSGKYRERLVAYVKPARKNTCLELELLIMLCACRELIHEPINPIWEDCLILQFTMKVLFLVQARMKIKKKNHLDDKVH